MYLIKCRCGLGFHSRCLPLRAFGNFVAPFGIAHIVASNRNVHADIRVYLEVKNMSLGKKNGSGKIRLTEMPRPVFFVPLSRTIIDLVNSYKKAHDASKVGTIKNQVKNNKKVRKKKKPTLTTIPICKTTGLDLWAEISTVTSLTRMLRYRDVHDVSPTSRINRGSHEIIIYSDLR